MPRGSRKIALPPFPGGSSDDLNPAAIPPGRYLESNNWVVRRQVGRPRPGYELVGSQLADANRVIGIGFRGSIEADANLVVHTTANAYSWDGTAFNAITGTWTSSDADQHVRFTTFQAGTVLRLIRTNEQNALDYWDGTGSFQNVGGSPPAARDISTVSDRVVVFNVTSGGTNFEQRVQWSDSTDSDTWGASSFTDLTQTPGPITAGRALGPLTMAVYKDDAVYLGTAQAALVPFQFQLISRTQGPPSPSALLTAADAHYWMTGDGVVYKYDGTGQPQVLSTSLAQTVRANLATASRNLIHGVYVTDNVDPEVWFFWPRRATTGPLLDRAISVNTRNGSTHLHSFTHSITAGSQWTQRASVSWDDLTGTWDTLSDTYDSWDAIETDTFRVEVLGSNVGNIYRSGVGNTDAGTAIAWSVTNGWQLLAEDGEDFYLDGVASYWVQTASLSITVGVLVTTALADSASDTEQTTTFDPSTNNNHQVTFPNQRGKWARVRFAAAASTGNPRYRGSLLTGWPRRMA